MVALDFSPTRCWAAALVLPAFILLSVLPALGQEAPASPLSRLALAELSRIRESSETLPRENLSRYFARYQMTGDKAEAERFLSTAGRITQGYARRLYATAEEVARASGAEEIGPAHVGQAVNRLLPGAPTRFKTIEFFPRGENLEVEIIDLVAFRDSPLPWVALAGFEPSGLPLGEQATLIFAEAVNAYGLVLVRLAGVAAREELAPHLTSPHLRQAEKTIFERARSAEAPPENEPANGSRFVDVTDEAGIDFRHVSSDWISRFRRYGVPSPTFSGGGLAARDFDGDGRADLVFCGGEGCVLYRNASEAEKIRFEDATAESGLHVAGEARMPLAADFDNDGDADLFITYARDSNRLFENLGDGKFRDVTSSSGLEREGEISGPAVAFDADGDGLLDIYVGNFGDYLAGDTPWISPDAENGQPNRLYRGLGGLRFEDATEPAGVGDTGWSQALSHADLDRDGDQDLYVANDFGRNELYLNRGDGTFEALGEKAGADDRYHGMNVAFTDLDRDLLADIFITNIWGWLPTQDEPGEYNTFLVSASGETGLAYRRDLEHIPELLDHDTGWSWAGLFFDAENDGDDDLFVVNGLTDYNNFVQYRRHPERLDALYPVNNSREENLFFANGGGTLRLESEAHGAELGEHNSRGLALLDFDLDGDLDLAVSTFHGRAHLFRNDGAPAGNGWLGVELEGSPERGSSRDAIGTQVIARGPGDLYVWRTVTGGEGYLSTSTPAVEIGLGSAPAVDLEICWPGMDCQTLEGVAANQRIRVRQGAEGWQRLP